MLPKLFSSAVRAKILQFLIMHPAASFTAGEIAQKTRAIIRSVNKEISKLVVVGAATEETRDVAVSGKTIPLKHYQANQQFSLYSEIRDLFLKLQLLELDSFKRRLNRLGNVHFVVLCGHFVGDASAPIDLLVVGEASHQRLGAAVEEFQNNVGWEVNWTLLPLEEYDYRQKVGDAFLYRILNGKRIELLNSLHQA